MISKMYDIILKGMLFSLLIIIFSCSQNNQEASTNDIIVSNLKKIEPDSLRRISSFVRNGNLVVVRYFINDSCDYIQLLLQRMDQQLMVKHQEKWKNIDSIFYYFPLSTVELSKERIIYTFNLMDELLLDEISTTCDYNVIFVTKDNQAFIHPFDSLYFKNLNDTSILTRVDDNWWR